MKHFLVSTAFEGGDLRTYLAGIRRGLSAAGAEPFELVRLGAQGLPNGEDGWLPFGKGCKGAGPDGIIADFPSDDWAANLPSGIQARINGSHFSNIRAFTTVASDDAAMGASAAAHFNAEGVHRVLILHEARLYANTLREAGLRERLLPSIPVLSHLGYAGLLLEKLAAWKPQRGEVLGIFYTHPSLAAVYDELCRIHPRNRILALGLRSSGAPGIADPSVRSGFELPLLELGDLAGRVLWKEFCDGRGDAPEKHLLRAPLLLYEEAHRSSASRLALRVRTMIDERLADSTLTIGSLADTLRTPRRTLEVAFSNQFGESPGAYLRRQRIDHAQSLLRSGSLRIVEVAERSGYASQHHFSAAFRKATGQAPLHFRRSAGL